MKEKPSNDPGDIVDLSGAGHPDDQRELWLRNSIHKALQDIESYPGHQPTEEEREALPEIHAAFERRWNEVLARDNSDIPLPDLPEEP